MKLRRKLCSQNREQAGYLTVNFNPGGDEGTSTRITRVQQVTTGSVIWVILFYGLYAKFYMLIGFLTFREFTMLDRPSTIFIPDQ